MLHDRSNQLPNIYGILGGSTHDCLEAITLGEATEEDLLPTVQKDLDELAMLDIDFPRDRKGGTAIRDGWIADMEHFCKTYKAPKGEFQTEQFFLYKSPGGNYLQGYIDLIRLNKDGTISIYDYKTSALYKGEDIKSHGRQLVLYALGKEAQGFKVKNVAWIFLKYCEVKYVGKKTSRSKKEAPISKVIERKNLIKDLEQVIIAKLEQLGMDELDIDFALIQAKENNEIPQEVADQFKVIPYVMNYELNDDIKNETDEYIDNTIEMWESLRVKDYEQDYSPIEFQRTQKNGKVIENIFYCTSLCGYRKVCPHLKKYLDTKQEPTDDSDLF